MLEDPRLISLFNVMRRHYLEKIPLYMYASCNNVSPHAASISAPIPTFLRQSQQFLFMMHIQLPRLPALVRQINRLLTLLRIMHQFLMGLHCRGRP